MMALPQGPDDYIRPAVGFLNVDYAFRKLEERAKINIKLNIVGNPTLSINHGLPD
jgi:hypothetical protein